jgi:hypothetical protein
MAEAATALIKKLGIKPGHRICILEAPAGYAAVLGPLPAGTVRAPALEPDLDVIHFFAMEAAGLGQALPGLKAHLSMDGMLWLSWPKKASALPTDLDRDVVRSMGLAQGLVDVKVCAVDADWSGLKFMYRLADRG